MPASSRRRARSRCGCASWLTGASGSSLPSRIAEIGMTAEQQAKLFQDFSQADSLTARRYGGVGVGLFLIPPLARPAGGGELVDAAAGTERGNFWGPPARRHTQAY